MKGIIFDLDGTIVLSEPLHYEAFCEIFKKFGVAWEYDEFIKNYAGTGSYNIIPKVLQSRGIKDFDTEALVAEKKQIFQRLLETKKLLVVPGFFEFLAEIKKRGLRKIIASGTNSDNVRKMLENAGILHEFPEIISGEDIKNAKPDPEIFLIAMSKLGFSKPEDCVVLEDSGAGVKAAKTGGFYCIAFTTTTEKSILEKLGADLIVKDYTEISSSYLDFEFNAGL